MADDLEKFKQQYIELNKISSMKFPNELLWKIDLSLSPSQELTEKLNQLTKEIAEHRTKIDWIKKFSIPSLKIPYELIERMKQYPTITKRVQEELAIFGWYLTGDILPKFIFWLNQKINSGEFDEIEDSLLSLARENVDEIEKRACKLWPSRAKIFVDAFNAHRKEIYTLSIPAMFSQIDAISVEIIGCGIFEKDKGKPKSKDAYKKNLHPDGIREGYWSDRFFFGPLENLSIMAFNIDYWKIELSKNKNACKLNRHAVMHGTDTEYASEANSLRVIMLLGYLEDLKGLYVDKKRTH